MMMNMYDTFRIIPICTFSYRRAEACSVVNVKICLSVFQTQFRGWDIIAEADTAYRGYFRALASWRSMYLQLL